MPQVRLATHAGSHQAVWAVRVCQHPGKQVLKGPGKNTVLPLLFYFLLQYEARSSTFAQFSVLSQISITQSLR